ncbi:phosphotransferase [Cochlodiniinecator piscidefendens]|uniref:phosphotransferase n=1 Tax=Cochlodiniinecator piscidefendens TaxID=2715756 RepID=UPI00140C0389|nr:phosphotransferase [Cochlodiniinecator piscidefendens]
MADKIPSKVLRDLIDNAGLDLANAVWSPMTGGRTNSLWKLETQRKCVVAKLFNDQAVTPLFPNDGFAEITALKALKQLGIAPDLIAHFQTSHGICILYRHIEGPTWSDDVVGVANLLARLHSLDIHAPMRVVESGSEALRKQTEAVLNDCQTKEAEKLRALMPTSCVSPMSRLHLIHGDVVSTNLISAPSGLRLIDWQCPGVGDPCEDIAVFLSPAMQTLYGNIPLNQTQITEFLAAYDQPEITDRYEKLRPWFHWRMAAYCLWKAARGATDYANATALEVEQLSRN